MVCGFACGEFFLNFTYARISAAFTTLNAIWTPSSFPSHPGFETAAWRFTAFLDTRAFNNFLPQTTTTPPPPLLPRSLANNSNSAPPPPPPAPPPPPQQQQQQQQVPASHQREADMDSSAVFAVFLTGLLQLQQWLLDSSASAMAALSSFVSSENVVFFLVALPWFFFIVSLLIALRYGQVTFPAPPPSPPSPAPVSLPDYVKDVDWEMRYGNLDKDNTTLRERCALLEQSILHLQHESRHQRAEIERLGRRLREAHEDLRTYREERRDPTSAAAYVELKDKKDILEARMAKLDRANKDLSKKLADREAAYQDLLAMKDDLQAKKGALGSERRLHQQTQSKVLDLMAECERLDKQLSAAKEAAKDAQRTAESREKALREQRDQARLLDLKARDAAQHQRQLDTKLREQAENGAEELKRTLGERDRTVRELCGRIQTLEEAEKRALDAADSSIRDLTAAREELKDAGRARKFAAVLSERDAAVKKAQGSAEQHQGSGTGDEIQSLKDQLAGVQKDVSSARSASQALETKLQTAESARASASSEVQVLQNKLAGLQEDFTAAQAANHSLQVRLQTAENGNSSSGVEIQTLQNKLASLQKQFSDAQSVNRALQTRVQTAEDGNGSSNGEIQTLQAQLASVQKDLASAQNANQALQTRAETAETGFNSASNEIQALKRQMQGAETTFSNVKDENVRLQREVNEAQKKASDANAENQRLQGIVGQATEINSRYDVAKAKFNEMHANLKAAETETKELRKAEQDLKKRIKDLDGENEQRYHDNSALQLQIKQSNSEYATKLLEKDAQLEEMDQKLVQALRACMNCNHRLHYDQCKNTNCPLSDDYKHQDEWNAGNIEAAQNMASLDAYAGKDLFEQHGVETIDGGLSGSQDPAFDPAFWNVTAGQDLAEGTQSNMPSQEMDTNEGLNDGAQSNVPIRVMDTIEGPDNGTQSSMPSQAMDTNEGLRESTQSKVSNEAMDTSEGLREPVAGLTHEEMEELDRTLDDLIPDTPPTTSANPSNVPGQESIEDLEFAHALHESMARLRKEDPHDQAFKPPALSTFTFGTSAPSLFLESAGPSVSSAAAARSTATARASNTSQPAQNTRARGTKRVARAGSSMPSAAWPTVDVPANTNAPAPPPTHIPGQKTCANCGMWALNQDGQCPGNCF
ncbi:hypothetical protein KC332_g3575 [Hortaea werneckii]|nr:hypothetical protein KC358_g3881 [Hortaea werneckii]KAI6848248.1 hypothetical protein KC350_g3093 [Hortaea werneckii]KAI6940628.1 hypothetical protein KC341_g3403 [Hortaea werneckii]KAI6948794.1 hypothetical protein KC348_g1753 [Hortaea werneckii]KAI6977286.1 hypothetical protein KC321_g3542 [Hortaea werneckii]